MIFVEDLYLHSQRRYQQHRRTFQHALRLHDLRCVVLLYYTK